MTGIIDTLDLFDDCVIPGCANPVADTGDVCPPCRAAFGRYLSFRPDTQPTTTAQITHPDDQVQLLCPQRAVTATSQPPPARERKANQTCWLCEQRRSCTAQPRGWECTTCHALT